MADLDSLKRERRMTKLSISRIQTRVLEYLKKPVTQELIDLLELDVADLRAEKSRFDGIQRLIFPELIANRPAGKSEADVENEWGIESEKIRSSLVNVVCRVTTAKRSLESAASRESLLNSTIRDNALDTNAVRLPKIEVPTFEGDIRSWNDFSNLFKNLIHDNPNLSNVQKLYYLKLAMKGPALEIIKDYTISDANYTEVWSVLTARFENRRATIKAHLGDFFGLQRIRSERDIRKLLDDSSKAMRSLKALGENIENWNTVVTYWVSSRLDDKTMRDWEISITDFTKYPTLKQLRTFLSARAAIYEDANNVMRAEKPEKKFEQRKSPESKTKTNLIATKVRCYVCSQNHYLPDCDDFKKKSPEQRFEVVKLNQLCINCFCKKHNTSDCKGPKCRRCDRKHHTLLHRQVAEAKEMANSPTDEKPVNEVKKTNLQISKSTGSVILPTAVVKVSVSGDRMNEFARVIFDSCSQANLVSEALVKRLKLSTFKSDSVLGCLGGKSVVSDYSCVITIVSRYSTKNELTFTADVVPYIPYEAPVPEIKRLNELTRVKYPAEGDFRKGKVEILIGAEHFERCFESTRKFQDDVAIRGSQFGTVISGKCSDKIQLNIPPKSHCLITIDEQLQKFWELEEVDIPRKVEDEEKLCVEHFEKTVTRNKEGRFMVRLPFKSKDENLAGLYYRAENALNRIERKCDLEMKAAVNEFMLDYKTKGHMKPTREKFIDKKGYYIPYQIVVRPDSSTTKIRVVFNASARTKSNPALNDILMKGPQLQPDIMTILIKFRMHKIAFTADIQQMYRQIAVHPSDAKIQKILWRYEKTTPIKEYELLTLTYGTTPASFIATKCLATIAENVKKTLPSASRAIATEFYMDDLMTGAEGIEEATKLQKQIHETLAKYCLPLRKYVSNSIELLNQLEPSLVTQTSIVNLNAKDDVSVLGLIWNPKVDSFQVKLNLPDLPEKITKRVILSELSRTFDPLGFLSPATIRGKLLLQTLWKYQLSWDQEISDDLRKNYVKYRNQLTEVSDVYIKRKIRECDKCESFGLCGFADASEVAYAAIVYAQCECEIARSSYIVCAKTRVAPLQGSTIPRLELRAAELLSDLICKVAKTLNVPGEKVKCYSDSTVVLSWLRRSPTDFKPFVSNRVQKIISLVPGRKWGYIKSEINPADMATRGTKIRECNSSLWLHGPSSEAVEECATRIDELRLSELPEVKKIKLCVITNNASNVIVEVINRNSNFLKILNVTAYLLRFRNNVRSSDLRAHCENIKLRAKEIEAAFRAIIRSVQALYYADELDSLKRKNHVPRKSKLLCFHPFIDSYEIIRVGGRLENANISYERKHPILVPANCRFAKLYFEHLHKRYYHASPTFLTNFVGQKIRFVGGVRNVARKICHDCLVCRKHSKTVIRQVMGQLPADRTGCSRPFAIVGIDYAGPYYLKSVAPRSRAKFKSYIAVFACYATKAVHLEVVFGLTTAAFLSALKRFTSRRGCPSIVYTDNATNFWGAANILDDEKIAAFPGEHRIEWKFNPPRAPHFGGVFEAAIKSMKAHLKKVLGSQILTFEELTTLVTEIEAVLNSRPISLTETADTDGYLTPGHFLTGSCILTPPEIDDCKTKLPQRWRMVQDMKRQFWKKWRNGYYNTYQKFTKWHKVEPNLRVDDIVFVKEDNLPPCKYLLGRVTKVFPGNDGKVRVAEVLTTKGTYLRAISKLSSALGSMFTE